MSNKFAVMSIWHSITPINLSWDDVTVDVSSQAMIIMLYSEAGEGLNRL